MGDLYRIRPDMSLLGISVNENVNDSQMTGHYNEVMTRLILERWTFGRTA